MEVKFEPPLLRKALQKLRPFVAPPNSQTHLPILRNVLLTTLDDPGCAQLTATNLTSRVKLDVACGHTGAGKVLLPYHPVAKFLSQGDNYTTIYGDSESLRIEQENIGSLTFKSIKQPEEYPPQPAAEFKSGSTAIDCQQFLRTIGQLIPCCATEDARPVLPGIVFEDGVMAAVDGSRLGVIDDPKLLFGLGLGNQAILPGKALRQLRRVFAGSEVVQVQWAGDYALFQVERAEVLIKKIPGKFPDYRGLIPTIEQKWVEFSAPLMAQYLSILESSGSIIKLSFSGKEQCCEIQCEGFELDSSYAIKAPAKVKEDFKIALHILYLQEAIKPFSICKMGISGVHNPVTLRGDIEELIYVIMPMFVQW